MPELLLRRGVRTLPVGDDVCVIVASLQARVHWANARGAAGVGIGVATPVAVRRGTDAPSAVPWGSRATSLVTKLVCNGAPAPEGEENDMANSDLTSVVPKVARAEEMVRAFAAAGTGEGVVGTATTAGDRTVVPLVETVFAGGYGGGGGSDSTADKDDIGAGGGGGGFARSRSVAIVELTPDEVRVRPVIDTTAIVLALLGVLAGLLGVRRRGRRH